MIRSSVSLVALVLALAAQPFAQESPAQKSDAKGARPVATVNLNTATAAELESLPGIGARTATRILEYRKTKGAFKKIEELMNVQGIGEKSFLKIRSQLTVGSTASASQQ
jgi:competence protein ComEA